MNTNKSTSQSVNFLDNIVIVSLAGTRIYSGRSKLTRKDLGEQVANHLPPDSLISLGVARTCDSKSLAPFASARSAAEQACLAVGTRLLGGFAMTPESAKEVLPKLEGIKTGFYKQKPDFLDNYQSRISDWGALHQEWRHLVDDHCHSVEYVDNNLHFGYSVFKVAPIGDDAIDFNLFEQAKGLSNQILNEVSTAAGGFYKKLTDKALPEMTMKGLNPLRQIQKKLSALKTIDPTVTPVIDLIDEFFKKLPAHNSVDGLNFMAVCWIVRMLSNVKEIKAYGENILQGNTSASSFVDLYYPKEDASATDESTESEAPVEDNVDNQAQDVLVNGIDIANPVSNFETEDVTVVSEDESVLDLSSLLVFEDTAPEAEIA